jgi:hypothetical protein
MKLGNIPKMRMELRSVFLIPKRNLESTYPEIVTIIVVKIIVKKAT